MPAYYNENDPKAAAWLRELIYEGHIADGVVDERSIEDLTPDDLKGYKQAHFFAGIGGWLWTSIGWMARRPRSVDRLLSLPTVFRSRTRIGRG